MTLPDDVVERASRRIQLWWMTQKHEPMHQDVATALARAALEAARYGEMRDCLQNMVRLADMDLEEALNEPEDNGNFATYQRARALLSTIGAA